MSDYGDFCREQRERQKKAKESARQRAHAQGGIIERLEDMGAYELTDGTYRLGCFNVYVYSNSAQNSITGKVCSVEYAIKNKDKEFEREPKVRRICGRKNWLDKHCEFKTTGVYRYQELNLDIYPNKSWARNYKTNESYSLDQARTMVKEHLKGKENV